jgi:O-antigen/teichoic acid export membrane protein
MTVFAKERTVASSLLVVGGAAGEYGIAFVSSIILTRMMPVGDYGFMSFLLSPLGIVSNICLFGLPFLFLCDVAKLEERGDLTRVRSYLDRGLVIAVTVSLVATALFILSWFLGLLPDHNEALLILAVYACPASLVAFAGYVFASLQRVRFAVIFQLILRLATLVTVVLAYSLAGSVVVAVAAAVLPLLIVAVLEWLLLKRIVPRPADRTGIVGRREVLRRSVSYGRWIVPQNIVATAFMPAAFWIVGFYSMTETAYLKIGVVLATLCTAPFVQLADVLQQRMSRFASYQEESLLRSKGREVQDIVMPAVIIVASLVIVVHRVAIRILYGSQYARSSIYVMVLVPSVVFYLLFYLIALVPNAKGRVDIATRAYVAELICFVGLAWASVRLVGAIGVAWAVLLARIMANLIMFLFFARHVVISARWMVVLPLLLFALLANWWAAFLIPYFGWLILLVLGRRLPRPAMFDIMPQPDEERSVHAG